MYVHDMHTVWECLKDRVRIEVRPDEALVTHQHEFPVPPALLWEYLTKPEYRAILMGASRLEIRNQAQGRTGVDAVFYCYHGDMETPQLILDWRPFEGFTTDDSNPFGTTSMVTYKFEPTQTGTRLIDFWGRPRGPWIRTVIVSLLQKFLYSPQVDKWAGDLAQRIQQDLDDGIALISPSIEVDKAQVASLATQVLTHDH
jgi:uncharacterized protein YndB with AHSA1/START domain